MNHHAIRQLIWEDCRNVRDLGGHTNLFSKSTRWRVFVRADNLARLNSQGIEALRSYGVATVVDLRSRREVANVSYNHVLEHRQLNSLMYINLPMVDRNSLGETNVLDSISTLEELYLLILERCKENIALIMQTLANINKGTTVFHCLGGKDRTGLIAAMLLAIADVPYNAIAEDYAASAYYLKPTYNETIGDMSIHQLQLPKYMKLLSSPPETITSILDYLQNKYGGVKEYLKVSGVQANDLNRIGKRLLED